MIRRVLITAIPKGEASLEGEEEGIHSSGAMEVYHSG